MDYELKLARAYCKLLRRVDWDDDLLVRGLREGLNKFLSNAFLSLYPRTNKYHRTHLASPAAIKQMRHGDYSGLVYEHIVPKQKYLQSECEAAARNGKITIRFVREKISRYWRIATITAAENRRLLRSMPPGWDEKDVRARYVAAKIKLQENPFFCSADERR